MVNPTRDDKPCALFVIAGTARRSELWTVRNRKKAFDVPLEELHISVKVIPTQM
jgi:hypothetical protein